MAPIIEAYGEGREIRWWNKREGRWEEPEDPDFEVMVDWMILSDPK